MSAAKKMYVVIPAFNRWRQTKACLDSLRASEYAGFQVIVVDHGSTDETRDELPRLYPDVIHLRESESLWWAGAVNAGIREALRRGATHLMLLNADCTVTPGLVGTLLSHAETAADSVIAPVQVSLQTGRARDAHLTSCFLLGFPTVSLPTTFTAELGKHVLIPTRLIIGGRGVLVPAGVFERVGLFDEVHLPHYGADHDFYLRCRRLGTALYIAADARVCVDESGTTMASNLGRLDFRQFLDTLVNRKSHRNVRELGNLFKFHYPVRWLYPLGLALNLMRYLLVYFWKRFSHIVLARGTSDN